MKTKTTTREELAGGECEVRKTDEATRMRITMTTGAPLKACSRGTLHWHCCRMTTTSKCLRSLTNPAEVETGIGAIVSNCMGDQNACIGNRDSVSVGKGVVHC